MRFAGAETVDCCWRSFDVDSSKSDVHVDCYDVLAVFVDRQYCDTLWYY